MKKVNRKPQTVNMDHAAATPIDPSVGRAMQPYLSQDYANPSAVYADGVCSKRAVEDARKSVAGVFGCASEEVVFTPGGTASDNLAVLGVARANRRHGRHVIVSAIEHEAVLEPARQLEREGFRVTFLPVDRFGRVDPVDVAKSLRKDTTLVSVMYANNEVGTVEPIRDIARVLRTHRKSLHTTYKILNTAAALPLLHTDACQAAGYLDMNVRRLGVDLMTVNASKIYGPKGVGALFVKKGITIEPILYGGGQERGLWSGTENVAAIVGFARAISIAERGKTRESKRLAGIRAYFIAAMRKTIPDVAVNGHPVHCLPNNVHVSIPGADGDALVLYLDAKGIAAAVGSACASRNRGPSHVLGAMGMPANIARSSIRFTLGRGTKKNDCDRVIAALVLARRLLA